MNIPNTKEKILNTPFQDTDVLIEAMYFFSKDNYVNTDLLRDICHHFPQFHIKAHQLEKKIGDYHHVFVAKHDLISQKISNTTFIRKETKNLYKQLQHTSQNKIKKVTVNFLSNVIMDISEKSYKLHFTNEAIDNLLDLLSDEEQLQNEFQEFQIKYINNMNNKPSQPYTDLSICMIDLFSHYYCDFYYDNKEHIKQIKETIHSVMSMSVDELTEYTDNMREKDAIDIPAQQGDTPDFLKQFYPQTVPSQQKRKGPFADENITKTRQNTLNTLLQNINSIHSPTERTLVEKTIEYFHDYFHKDPDSKKDNELLQFYLINVMQTSSYRKEHINDGTKTLWDSYLINSYAIYQEHTAHPKYDEKVFYNPVIKNDFFLFLAHSLLSGNQEFKEEFIHYCLDLLCTKPKIAQNYTDIMNDIQNNKFRFHYSPHQMYENIIVMSVIYELDTDRSIPKEIRHLLMKHYPDIYDCLAHYNRKGIEDTFHSRIFENDNCVMNEYAVMFLLSYFREPVYITVLSPLIFQFIGIIEENISDYFETKTQLQKKNSYEKQINELIAKLKEPDCDYLDSYQSSYKPLFKVATDNSFLYDDFDHCVYMIEKYKEDLAYFLSLDLEDVLEDFQDWDFDEQISYLWEHAVEMSLVKEIFTSYKYLPTSQDLLKASYQTSLEETIQQQKEELHDKDLEIEKYKAQVHSLNRILKKENTENNKSISKLYSKEISDLNKQIVKKNERIEELEENQNELFKLRELMFELQTEQDSQPTIQDIDYSSELFKLTNSKKIVCVGGHTNLITALKSKYPNLIFITHNTSVSNQVVHNADYIFFFYNNLDHGLYYKIMSLINLNYQVKWNYISSRNMALVERDMYTKFICNEKSSS